MNLQDISLLISFVTSPSEECATDFFSDNFENPNAPIFKTYRDKILAYLKSNDTAKFSDLKDDNEFQRCSKCDGHDACEDFGCAFKAGLGHLVENDDLPF